MLVHSNYAIEKVQTDPNELPLLLLCNNVHHLRMFLCVLKSQETDNSHPSSMFILVLVENSETNDRASASVIA